MCINKQAELCDLVILSVTGPRGTAQSCQGRGCGTGCQAAARPELLGLRECWDTKLSHRVWVGVLLCGAGSDLVPLVGPFQLGIFYGSVIYFSFSSFSQGLCSNAVRKPTRGAYSHFQKPLSFTFLLINMRKNKTKQFKLAFHKMPKNIPKSSEGSINNNHVPWDWKTCKKSRPSSIVPTERMQLCTSHAHCVPGLFKFSFVLIRSLIKPSLITVLEPVAFLHCLRYIRDGEVIWYHGWFSVYSEVFYFVGRHPTDCTFQNFLHF